MKSSKKGPLEIFIPNPHDLEVFKNFIHSNMYWVLSEFKALVNKVNIVHSLKNCLLKS